MFLTKKLILANVFLGSAFLATLGTAALAYALTDPDCRHKLKDCANKMRNCNDKMCNRSSDIDVAEKAQWLKGSCFIRAKIPNAKTFTYTWCNYNSCGLALACNQQATLWKTAFRLFDKNWKCSGVFSIRNLYFVEHYSLNIIQVLQINLIIPARVIKRQYVVYLMMS